MSWCFMVRLPWRPNTSGQRRAGRAHDVAAQSSSPCWFCIMSTSRPCRTPDGGRPVTATACLASPLLGYLLKEGFFHVVKAAASTLWLRQKFC